LWSALGVGAADVAQLANEFVTWILPVCVFFALSTSPHGEGDLAVASRALLVVVLGSAVLAFSQVMFFMGRSDLVPGVLVGLARRVADETWFGSFRVYGTFPTIGPNMFGVFLLIPTAILLSRASGTSGASKWGWGFCAVVAVAMIAASLSRGAQLGLVITLVLLPLWRRSWRMAAAVAGLGLLGLIALSATPAWQHAVSLFTGGQLDSDVLERVSIWRTILREASGHPLGYGFDGWIRVSGRLIDIGVSGGANTVGSSYPAENQWLRELADRGPMGVAALVVLVGGLLVVTYRSAAVRTVTGWRHDFMAGAGAGIGGFSVAMLTGDHLTYDSVAGMFWFVAALVVSAAPTHATQTAQDVSKAYVIGSGGR